MIDAQKEAEIRRLYFAEHWKVGTIVTELGVHPDAVRRAINADRIVAALKLPRTSPLDAFKAFIDSTLAQYPRLRCTRLWQMLHARGYSGSVCAVRRHVRKVRPHHQREAFFRLETLPGEQAQVDWAHFGKVRVGNAMRTLSCFVMVLGYSRAMFARFFFDQTTDNFLRGHVEAFAALGGVGRIILYDNLKSVVLDRIGEHVRFNPRLLELAGYYHFQPRPCAPYRGNEKGKVERSIHYLRYSFFEGRQFRSLDALNAELADWIANTAHTRTLVGHEQTVAERLASERSVLLSLPERPFATDTTLAVVAKKTPYIRFDLNDYSIPHALVGRALTLIASEKQVRIVDGLFEVASHPRCYERARRIESKVHLQALEGEKRRARELRGRHRLIDLCPSADALLQAAAQRNQSLSHYTLGLLRLIDRFDPNSVDAAIANAVQRGAIGLASIEHLLEQQRQKRKLPPTIVPTLLLQDRAADLRTVHQSLQGYDALGGHQVTS